MAKEIERKFLITDPSIFKSVEYVEIVQGYLSEAAPVVRVRVKTWPSEGFSGPVRRAWMTVKSEGLLERDEVEFEIPFKEANELLWMSKRIVRKKRRMYCGNGHLWDIDEVPGIGLREDPNTLWRDPSHTLWIAEIELQDKDEQFERPLWLGREVTENGLFSNLNLATPVLRK